MALAAGMYYLLQNPNRKEPLISTTASTKTFAPTTAPKTTAESTTSPKTTAATVTSMKTTVATTTSPRATSGATTFTSSNRTYDCVQGSITKLVVGGTLYQLADLKIPEQCPTLTVGSLEYLLVPRATSWWYAQKYCTAWCGYLVSIKDSDENAKILDMVKQNLSDIPINYWIGLKAWSNKWYLDDESDVKYFNFPNKTQADKDMFNINNMQMGCVLANSSGLWSLMNCDAPLPFVCERNTAENINRIPFAPYEEKLCQEAGGKCKWENDCGDDSHHKLHLCRDQPNNIQCCIPNNSIKTCADVGGICRHIDADQCRGGRVIFDLPIPCADGPRPYACCIENEHIS
uniref:C-type lectin domain-containing protein n=1 Tax=Plectus sambesii TaxID=2011161 RepID=A0A914X9L3_9BILA